MDDLSMALVRLCKRNKDGAFGTQKNRQRGLTAMAKELVDLGYKLPKANSIKPKHVSALMESWQSQDLTTATIRNRLSWLRWWAEKVDKAPVVARDNDVYGIAVVKNRKRNRAQALDTSKLNKITCPYVRV
ncbi:MAG: integrase, partial [Alphaproteobacteria bacterium]|nr:integrase [Alphaproteobacteria bacterium]